MTRPRNQLATVLCMLAIASAATAQDAARLAPANTGVFIEADGLAALRAQWDNDSLATFLRQQLPPQRQPAAWRELQDKLGMTGPQIIDTYFGRSVALIGRDTQDGSPALLLSKVNDADAQIVQQRLELRAAAATDTGAFKLFTSKDEQAWIAFGGGWMAIADRKHSDYAARVLRTAGQGASLADDPQFKTWLAKLPAARSVVAFARRPDQGEVHALSATFVNRNLSLHYAGQSPNAAKLLSQLGGAGALAFGPLPVDTLAAVTLNVHDMQPQDTQFVDRLLAPKTYKADVLPKLDAPLVLFIGQVKGADLTPDPGLAVPVLGVAVKLKDPAVAADIDRVMDNLMLLANVASMKWQTPPIVPVPTKHGEVTFRVADVGATLAARAGRPELAAVKLSYGRVGDWYVACTQDTFFKRCIDAQRDPNAALTNSADFTAMPLEAVNGSIATLIMRPAAMSTHIQTWLDHWKNVRPEVIQQAQTNPTTPEANAVKAATVLAGVLAHYQSISFQAHKGAGENEVSARIEVIRK